MFEAVPQLKQMQVGNGIAFGIAVTCPVYLLLNSHTVDHKPSLQVFGVGIPLLCWFNCAFDL